MNRPFAGRSALVAILTVVACGEAPRDDSAGGSLPRRTIPDWTVTWNGIGPLEIGMTANEAGILLGDPGLASDTLGPECHYVRVEGAPGRVLAMIVDRRIVRIDIKDSAVATERGARVGDNQTWVEARYRGQVMIEPHKYTDGRYLVVSSSADTLRRLIFETDGTRVTAYRIGRLPEVAWVEGCS